MRLIRPLCCCTYGLGHFALLACKACLIHRLDSLFPSSDHWFCHPFHCRSTTTVRGFGMVQGIRTHIAINTVPHGEMEMRILLKSISGPAKKQHKMSFFWRAEKENARFTSPLTFETCFPFKETGPHYGLHVGGFLEHVNSSTNFGRVVNRFRTIFVPVPHRFAEFSHPFRLKSVPSSKCFL